MTFPGLKKAADRANVIAYMKSQNYPAYRSRRALRGMVTGPA